MLPSAQFHSRMAGLASGLERGAHVWVNPEMQLFWWRAGAGKLEIATAVIAGCNKELGLLCHHAQALGREGVGYFTLQQAEEESLVSARPPKYENLIADQNEPKQKPGCPLWHTIAQHIQLISPAFAPKTAQHRANHTPSRPRIDLATCKQTPITQLHTRATRSTKKCFVITGIHLYTYGITTNQFI